jgi:hypothetical protein
MAEEHLGVIYQSAFSYRFNKNSETTLYEIGFRCRVSGFRIDIRAIQINADIESVKMCRFPLFSSIPRHLKPDT